MEALNPPEDAVLFEFAGRMLKVQFDYLCEYVLDRRGIDAKDVFPKLFANAPGRFSTVMDVFAAMLANNYDTDAGERVPSAEFWLRQFDQQPDRVKEASEAVAAVLKKRLLTAKDKILATLPATTETTPAVS